jgi:Ca-activated chloride channel family protein
VDGSQNLVKLNRKAMLDRDFVLKIDKLDGIAFSTVGADPFEPGKYVALTSFSPNVPKHGSASAAKNPLNLKILIDCSGSMAGDSMSQARSALSALIDTLTPDDTVSFSKFGNQTANILGTLAQCTPDYIDELRDEVHRLDASMGGTELNRALHRVMAIKDEMGALPESAAVILITDGEVWDIEEIVATVRQAKHRIFAVGVGSAPAESLLQDLAVVSGGHCSMVSPKDDMRPSMSSLISRLRSSAFVDAHVRYDADSTWQSPNPIIAMDGDTVHQWSKLEAAPAKIEEISWSAHSLDTESQGRHNLSPPQITTCDDGVLARLFAAQYLLDTTDEQVVRAVALKYQLITRFTNFFLVFQREDGDKASQLPALQQIEHMQAAGWSGASTVYESDMSMSAPVMFRTTSYLSVDDSLATPSVWRTNRTASKKAKKPRFATLSQAMAHPADEDNPIKKLIESLNRQSMRSNNFKQAWRLAMNEDAVALMKPVLEPLAQDGVSISSVWATFLIWLCTEKGFKPSMERFAMRLSRGETATMAAQQRLDLVLAFEAEAAKHAPAMKHARFDMDALAEGMDDDELVDPSDYEIPAFLRKQAD